MGYHKHYKNLLKIAYIIFGPGGIYYGAALIAKNTFKYLKDKYSEKDSFERKDYLSNENIKKEENSLKDGLEKLVEEEDV